MHTSSSIFKYTNNRYNAIVEIHSSCPPSPPPHLPTTRAMYCRGDNSFVRRSTLNHVYGIMLVSARPNSDLGPWDVGPRRRIVFCPWTGFREEGTLLAWSLQPCHFPIANRVWSVTLLFDFLGSFLKSVGKNYWKNCENPVEFATCPRFENGTRLYWRARNVIR